jgi:hypothetical protein
LRSAYDTCAVVLGNNDVEMLAVWLGALGRDFEFDVREAAELARQLRVLAARYGRAADGRSTVRGADAAPEL